jgi:hypothetical protein
VGHGRRPARAHRVILPSFVIAGAPRCGTTSLHYYLRQHPQVCMSAIKEPNFFLFGRNGTPAIGEEPIIRKSIRRLAEYAALFRPHDGVAAVGEASPLYLYARPAAAEILAVCGVIQVVCVLRRPAERAWSHFLYAFPDVPEGERTSTFAELVEAEMRGGPDYEPYRTRTHLLRLGRYAEQVQRYHDTFGAENVLVLLTEDLADDRSGALGEVCRFIGVDDDVQLELDHRYNTSGAPAPSAVPGLRRVVRRAQPRLKRLLPARVAGRLAELRVVRADGGLGAPPPLDPDLARRIADWCADDIDALARLLGRDLSGWQLQPTS